MVVMACINPGFYMYAPLCSLHLRFVAMGALQCAALCIAPATGGEDGSMGWRQALYGALMRASLHAFENLDLMYHRVRPPAELDGAPAATDSPPKMVRRTAVCG